MFWKWIKNRRASIRAKSRARVRARRRAKDRAKNLHAPIEGLRIRRPYRAAYWVAVAGVWLAMATGVFALYLAHDLPDLENLPPPGAAERIEVRAENGSLIATYGAIYGEWLDFQEIPPLMVQAIISVEDRRFYSHMGLDPRAVGRAFFANVAAGGIREGASTITQQLAKNIFLSPDRTFKRKAQEVLLSLWLEGKFTKNELLTIYLNRVYFGSGTYGIDGASRKFFGHSARTLSLGEAALLTGLVKAPSAYAPTRSLERAYTRMGEVLGIMIREGVVSEETGLRAGAELPAISARALGQNNRYFTDWVVERLAEMVPRHSTALIVYTSLDRQAQDAAERALRSTLQQRGPAANAGQGAIVAMASDGSIKAMVGGVSYGLSQFNRAVKARRQPGSAFKAIVYLAGLEAGLTSETIIVDQPVTINGWTPRNYSGEYKGTMSLMDAFASSVNSVAVRVSEQAGRGRVAEIAARLGIKSHMRPHPSIALGSSEVTPMELTAAYAAIGNGGYRVTPHAILEVRSGSGELIYRRIPTPAVRVISEENAATLSAMMSAVIRRGTGRAAAIDRPAAGKTGTSQDFRDAWFLGFTNDLVAGVWVGNDDNAPMRSVTGGGLPARIWADFMIAAHAGKPPRPLLFDAFEDPAAGDEEQSSLWDRLFGKKR